MIDFYKKLLKGFHKLHIDLETYSSEDLGSAGVYKYVESVDFEILMVAYAFDDKPIEIVDLAAGEKLPDLFIRALFDPSIKKCAHNTSFERNCLRAYGYNVPIEEWECTMVKVAYCGLPLNLDQAGKALNFNEEKLKDSAGKALIRYFCTPCKPTKSNGNRHRNFYYHDPDKWQSFKNYCIQDVNVEREIDKTLEKYVLPEFERQNYILDQIINDRGVLVDLDFVDSALYVEQISSKNIKDKLYGLTGLDNVNSPAQLKQWTSDALEQEIDSLAKADVDSLIAELGSGTVHDVLQLRKKLAKTSIKKYKAMVKCAGYDRRARGLFQFYGANRTGRWAGRLIQLQNLPRNYMKELNEARSAVKNRRYDLLSMLYDDIPNVLSQLIRTCFVPPSDCILAVSDFSAIEARVTAWLANEKWRLDVFKTHGKIYEASAAAMFNVPIEEVTKGSEWRTKGKIAELALGYQGALGAMKKMGGEAMGLSDDEMKSIVKYWRKSNPAIVKLWDDVEECAIQAVLLKKPTVSKNRGLVYDCDGDVFTIRLPSGRKLFYQSPSVKSGRYGKKVLVYKGLDQITRQWTNVDTYGGKLVENIVQAISRDLLAHAIQRLHKEGFKLIMHIHDEIVAEIPKAGAELKMDQINAIMGSPIEWAPGLPLAADGYLTDFYKKD